jgi:hypothetical protein
MVLGAGETVWVERRSIKDMKRKEILDQLDSLKWNAIAKIEAG